MTELMLKMTLWLVAAIVLGLIFGWLLSKAIQKKKYNEKLEALDAALLEKNEILERLEKKFHNEKIMFSKMTNDFRLSEKVLVEKTSLITGLHAQLAKIQNEQNDILETKGDNRELLDRVEMLEVRDLKRKKELEEFETVLLKAEEQIERLTLDNEEQSKTIKVYKKSNVELEDELKLYSANSEDDEFVISKDQFTKIEEQLGKYQEEILVLKNEKNELMKNRQEMKSEQREENNTMRTETLDDGSIVKLFRETYKKITKS